MQKLHIQFFLLLTLFAYSQEDLSIHIDKKETNYLTTYFDAEKHKVLEDYEKALVLYEKCISINPQESSAYNEIAKIYFFLQDLDNSEYYIKEALSLDPANKWYYYLLLDIYIVQANMENQLDIYTKLIEIEENNFTYYLQKLDLLRQLKLYKKAIRFINKSTKLFGSSTAFIETEIDIYLAQANYKLAEKKAIQLVKLFPNSNKSYSILARVYLHFSEYESAISVYEQLLINDPINAEAIVALYRIHSNKKDLKGQQRYLLEIAKNTQINIETKRDIFYQLLLENDINEYVSFKAIVQSALELDPEDPLLNLILGDICTKEQNFDQAITHYRFALRSSFVKDEYVYNKLLEIYYKKNNYDAVISTAKEAIEKHPFSPRLLYFKGIAHINKKQYSIALKDLTEGCDLVFDNPNLKSEFYSLLGDVYHSLNNNQMSDESYSMALEYNNNNTLVLNNYSYYLALRGENLNSALEMIMRCVDLTNEMPNASFLDTYAWVLYKLEKYKQARNHIEMALELHPNSATLHDHYGDILYKLGDIKSAIVQWKTALSIDIDNNELKDKIKKHE